MKVLRRDSPAALALAAFILAAPLAAAAHAAHAHREVAPLPCEDGSLHLCAAKCEPQADPCVFCRASAERAVLDAPALQASAAPDQPAPDTASIDPSASAFSPSSAPRAPPSDAR
ncbi:MAG: hypothetical protein ACK44W_02230 [Planctomycetota bacterium]